jgi:hypothetical protein
MNPIHISPYSPKDPAYYYPTTSGFSAKVQYVLLAMAATFTKTNKQTPWPLVRERTIPTDRPPLVDEI